MRVASVLVLIILMEGTDNFVMEKEPERNGEQKLLLRKLLSLQNNSTEKSTMWNEIFANVLVDKIRMKTEQQEDRIEDEPNIITEIVSGIIGLFRKCYWDKVDERHHKNIVYASEGNKTDEGTVNPKDQVEDVDPKYHGRIVNATEDSDIDKRTVCPVDSVRDGKGNCVDQKNQKFILAIPYQCPFGYRRDGLGYCRPLF